MTITPVPSNRGVMSTIPSRRYAIVIMMIIFTVFLTEVAYHSSQIVPVVRDAVPQVFLVHVFMDGVVTIWPAGLCSSLSIRAFHLGSLDSGMLAFVTSRTNTLLAGVPRDARVIHSSHLDLSRIKKSLERIDHRG